MLSIYKASAGSGKTYNLVLEYIRLLIGVKDPDTGRYKLNPRPDHAHRHILAVTFTNKSTEEMKQRIITELAQLALLEPVNHAGSKYTAPLMNEFGCTESDLVKSAQTALRQLIYDYNFFQVSTIDAFFQTILRTFAREADLAGNYEVDLDNERAIGQGIRDLFDSLELNSGSESTRQTIDWVTDYLLYRIRKGSDISIFNRNSRFNSDITGFISRILNDVFAARRSDMMDYFDHPDYLKKFTERVGAIRESLTAEMKTRCEEALNVIRKLGYTYVKPEKGKKAPPGISANAYNKLVSCASGKPGPDVGKTIPAILEDPAEAFNAALKAQAGGMIDAGLGRALLDAADAIVRYYSLSPLYTAAMENIYMLGLLRQVLQHVERFRADNNTILLSDTNAMLREIIGDDDAPFVYERIGVWINHFLIDEFQDTARMQWDNLRPLLEEGNSKGFDSLIIGDEKQCIYRFRYSDPNLLKSEVQEQFPETSRLRGTKAEENTNHRSRARVISFNNQLFERLASDCGVADVYAHVNQNIPDDRLRENNGYVKIMAIAGESPRGRKKGKKDAAPDEGAALAVDRKKAGLDLMYGEIRRELDLGYFPSEICVLVRGNNTGSDVIDYLMNRLAADDKYSSVKVISDDAMAIEKSPAVRLLVSKLRFMADSVISEATEGRTDSVSSRIMRLSNNYEHFFASGLEPSEALTRALTTDKAPENVLTSDKTANYNLPSLVERMIARYIDRDTARDQNMFISAFVDCVGDFCSRGAVDINTFLEWWDDAGHKARVTSPADKNAIRVMTVHKSKGLQFKCVHVPFADWPMAEFKDVEWFDALPGGESVFHGVPAGIVPPMYPFLPSKYMEGTGLRDQYRARVAEVTLDELNVLYVAFTRAEEELIVGYSEAGSENTVSGRLRNALAALWPEAESCPEKGIAECRTFGTPSPTVRKDSGKTALTSEATMEMKAYRTDDRDDLWKDLRIERYCDYVGAAERGTALHGVLEPVTDIASIPGALDRAVYRGLLPAERRAEVEMLLREKMEDVTVRQWFEGYRRLLRERSLVVAGHELRRPDRVVWTADGHIDVVDYKFGIRCEEHFTQVREYVDCLRSMGYDRVRGFLWYVEKGTVVPVG